MAGWVEMLMLRRTLNARIGKTGIPADYMIKLWSAAAVAAAAGWAAKLLLPHMGPRPTAVLVFGPFGLAYFGAASLLRVPELSTVLDRVRRLRK
jgi:putative peptidoglycan lipid II flippase